MKMIYQEELTGKTVDTVKISGCLYRYKTIKGDSDIPKGWLSHSDIISGANTKKQTESKKESAAKEAMEKKCLAETGVNLDRRMSLEDMQVYYDKAKADKAKESKSKEDK